MNSSRLVAAAAVLLLTIASLPVSGCATPASSGWTQTSPTIDPSPRNRSLVRADEAKAEDS